MKWVSIVGNRHHVASQLEQNVQGTVIEVFKAGNSVVAGGALGISYLTTEVVLG